MAGPYFLAPDQVQNDILTWTEPTATMVLVEAVVAGSFEMTAGGSPTETTSLAVGVNTFERHFGGVLLTVKNLTKGRIIVTTK